MCCENLSKEYDLPGCVRLCRGRARACWQHRAWSEPTATRRPALRQDAYLQHIVAIAFDAADADVELQRRVEGGVRAGADYRRPQEPDALAALRARLAAWLGNKERPSMAADLRETHAYNMLLA